MSERTNRLAVNATEAAALKRGWFFRSQEVSDQGIDALIEKFECESGADGIPFEVGTGRLIAVQIKGGQSYFRERSPDGWWFRFDSKKMRLWGDHALPVIVVLVDLEGGELYWQRISSKTAIRAGNSYKVNVPSTQKVSAADDAWSELASGLERHAESRLEFSLLSLPPSVRTVLSGRTDSEGSDAAILAMHLAEGRTNPEGTVTTLLAASPTWLATNGQWAWLAVGNYSVAYGLRDAATEAFVRAAELAEDKSRIKLLVNTALHLHSLNDSRANAFLAQAEAENQGPGDEILLAAARTVMSTRADDSSPWTVDSILLTDNEELRSSAVAQRVLSIQARRVQDLDGAVKHAKAAFEADTSSPDAMSLLADSHFARWSTQSASSKDLKLAVDFLRKSIEQSQLWAGPTADLQERLAAIHIASGQLEAALDSALPPPLGTAQAPATARSLRIAAHAAYGMGRRDILAQVVALLGNEPADVLAKHDVDALELTNEQVITFRHRALESAIEEQGFEEIIRHGLDLITMGVDIRDMLQPFVERAIFPPSVLKLASALLAAHKNLDAALPELRELAKSDPIAGEKLIYLLRDEGRNGDASEAAQALYELTGSTFYLLERANALIADGAGAGAVSAAMEAVGHVSGHPTDIERLLTFLGGSSADQGDWATAARYLQQAIDLFDRPSDAQVWNLVVCLVNQGHLNQAAKVIAGHRPTITSFEEAKLWLKSHSAVRWNREIAFQAYALAERFDDPDLSMALISKIISSTHGVDAARQSDSGSRNQSKIPDHVSTIVAHIPECRDVLTDDIEDQGEDELRRRREMAQDEVPADLHRKSLALMEKLVERHGDRTGATILKSTNPDDLVTQFFEYVKQKTDDDSTLTDLVQLARAGRVPIGFLAGVKRRGIATLVIERALGVLLASSPDDDEHDIEVAVARGAIAKSVVVDSTAVVTLSGLAEPNALTGQFVSLLIPPAAMYDLHRATSDVRGLAGSPGSVKWDQDSESVAQTELSETEFTRLFQRAERLEPYSDRLLVRSLVSQQRVLEEFSADPHHAPWSDVIELSAQQGKALWSDDIGLRRIARDKDISTFGTPALIDAIRDLELEASNTHVANDAAIDRSIKLNLELARDFIVDLPLNIDHVLILAEEDNWTTGAAAAVISRPAWWTSNPDGLSGLQTLYGRVRAHSPMTLPAWQLAAMHGLASALQPESAIHALAEMALLGFGGDPSDLERAAGLRQARIVAKNLGYPDPADGLARATSVMKSSSNSVDRDNFIARILKLADEQDVEG